MATNDVGEEEKPQIDEKGWFFRHLHRRNTSDNDERWFEKFSSSFTVKKKKTCSILKKCHQVVCEQITMLNNA